MAAGAVGLHALAWDGRGGRMPFLLVHGLASNCLTWAAVASRLHGRGHDVVALDLRGHGQSDKPEGGYDLGTMAGDVVAALDTLGWERVVVAGQSTGGNVAVGVAHRDPRVVAVAGVDGGAIELAERWPEWDDCERDLAPPELAGMPVDRVEAWLRGAHPDWDDEAVAATMANFEVRPEGVVVPRLSREHHLQILRSLWEHRPTGLLPDIAVPVLLILADTGDGSIEAKRAEAARAVAAGRTVGVEWVSPADHDLHVQKPDLVADLLARLAVQEGR